MENYFIERIGKDIDEIKADMKEIRNTIADLDKFKFKVLGAAVAVSVIWTILINVAYIVWGAKH